MSRRALILGTGGAAVSAVALATGLPHRGTGQPTDPAAGRWLALGSVAVVAATRWSAAPGDHAEHAGQHHDDHDDHDGAGRHQVHAASPTGHGVWTDTVLVDLAVSNTGTVPVLVSAGQFRLRVDGDLGVSYYEAQDRVSAVAPGAAVQTRISFLAPPRARELALEYTEAGAAGTVSLPLRPVRPQVGS